jgi:mannosyl-3-phosphoglycerate phosphatase family protein
VSVPIPRLVIVTDLDGTLLDARDYSRTGASATLARLARDGVPVVLCSSKTRAEMERCRCDAGLEHPYISENGGALFVPDGYFPFDVEPARRVPGYAVIEFGWHYDRVARAVRAAADESRARVVGFRDMPVTDLARLCHLSIREAQLALMREYDEPFLVEEGSIRRRYRFFRALRRSGLQCTRGGRFHHAYACPGKGRAVEAVRELYARASGAPVVMVGLGDALNDLSLLRAVDIPIVVPNETIRWTTRLLRQVKGARLAPAPGPRGWARAVRELTS